MSALPIFLFWKPCLDEVSSSVKDLPPRLLDFPIIGPQELIVRILIKLTHSCFNDETGSYADLLWFVGRLNSKLDTMNICVTLIQSALAKLGNQ